MYVFWKRILLGFGATLLIFVAPAMAQEEKLVDPLKKVLEEGAETNSVLAAADELLQKSPQIIRINLVPYDSHYAVYRRLIANRKLLDAYIAKFENVATKVIQDERQTIKGVDKATDDRYRLTPAGAEELERTLTDRLNGKKYGAALVAVEELLRHPVVSELKHIDYEISKALIIRRLGISGKDNLGGSIYARHRDSFTKRAEPLVFGTEMFNFVSFDRAMDEEIKEPGDLSDYLTWLDRIYRSGFSEDRELVTKEFARLTKMGGTVETQAAAVLGYLTRGCRKDDDRFLTVKGGCLDRVKRRVWNPGFFGKRMVWTLAFEKCSRPIDGLGFHLANENDMHRLEDDADLQRQLGVDKKAFWTYETWIQTLNSSPTTPKELKDEDDYLWTKEIHSHAVSFGETERGFVTKPQVCKPSKDPAKSDCYVWEGRMNYSISSAKLSQQLESNKKIVTKDYVIKGSDSQYLQSALCVDGAIAAGE